MEPEPGQLDPARIERAAALLARHGTSFRRTARRYSLCADDADDAYQRAALVLLTRAPADFGLDRLAAWMHVVTRREAGAVRRQRERLLGPPGGEDRDGDGDPAELVASPRPGPDDALERRELVERAAGAIAALKPQERRALGLKAAGCSYAEIQAITGWTYTKVNRCMAEGRRSLLERLAGVEGA